MHYWRGVIVCIALHDQLLILEQCASLRAFVARVVVLMRAGKFWEIACL